MMARLLAVAGAGVVPLALLLFAQWPLRDAVQAYAREANDLGQIVFAVYAAVAITAASRSKSHLALVNIEKSAIKFIPTWRSWAMLACVAPWAGFMLWAAVPQMWLAIVGQERFGETLVPGYFILRMALVLMVVLVLVDTVAQVWPRRRAPPFVSRS